MNRFEDYLRNRDPILYEEISDEQKGAETRMSRRGLLGLGALGTMGLLAGYGGRQAKNSSDEDDWDYSDEEEPTTAPAPAPAPQSPTRPSPQPTRTRKSTDDAEAYLKSLGPIRQWAAKHDPNSIYHQKGGTKRTLLSRLFHKKRR